MSLLVRGQGWCTFVGGVISGSGCVWQGSKHGSGSEIEVGSHGYSSCGVTDNCWCAGDLNLVVLIIYCVDVIEGLGEGWVNVSEDLVERVHLFCFVIVSLWVRWVG